MSTIPIPIFCCYAPADEPSYRELEMHLSPLLRQGLVTLWHRRRLVPGTNRAALSNELNTAPIILLLISPHFFGSDNCYQTELSHTNMRSVV